MKYKINILYRDASNYKDYITIERDSKEYPVVETLSAGDEEIEMESIGITLDSFEMIREYGEDSDDDHCFVEIEEIQLVQ